MSSRLCAIEIKHDKARARVRKTTKKNVNCRLPPLPPHAAARRFARKNNRKKRDTHLHQQAQGLADASGGAEHGDLARRRRARGGRGRCRGGEAPGGEAGEFREERHDGDFLFSVYRSRDKSEAMATATAATDGAAFFFAISFFFSLSAFFVLFLLCFNCRAPSSVLFSFLRRFLRCDCLCITIRASKPTRSRRGERESEVVRSRNYKAFFKKKDKREQRRPPREKKQTKNSCRLLVEEEQPLLLQQQQQQIPPPPLQIIITSTKILIVQRTTSHRHRREWSRSTAPASSIGARRRSSLRRRPATGRRSPRRGRTARSSSGRPRDGAASW